MPERVTWPDGSISKTVYDARGDLVSSTDQNNRTTTYAWNNRRLPTQATLPGGATLAQEYDACGNLTKSIDALDIATTFTWSVSGELLASTSASGTPEAATTTHAWYNNGWGKSITDPLGRTTTFAYDEAGNLAKVTDPLGRVSQNLFDAAGALNWTKTPRGHTTLFNYTSDGALLVSQDPAGGQTWNTYNGFGEQTALRNRRGAIYAFEYDANGNPTRLTTPTGKSASTTWNVRDLVAQHTKASGGETSYTYDTVGRVTQQADGAGTITFGYDAKGNPLTVSEGGGGGTLTRTFDELDRVESYSNANNETIGYSYNAGGQLTRLTYPDGKTVDYTYTALGQLKTLTDWANRTTTYEWDKAGRLIKIVRPNGTHRENRYDQAGQLISFQERDGSGQLLAYGGYSYDADGNMTTRLRLPQAAAGSAGALLAMTAGYDADNRMAQWNGLSVVHDADGNMTSGPLSLSGPPESPTISLSNYSYDARNRLVSVGSTSYGYDAENNRISQTTTEGTTHYTVDPHGDALSRVLVRTKPDGTKTHYVYGLGLAYEVNDSAAPAYYHFDHLGSTVALTDATGTVTDRVEYGVYGHIAYRSGSTDTPYLYVGQLGVQTDANGLTYMRARYFNSLLMRFVNADPVGFSGGSNWYAYADNNPMQLVDPSGFIAGSIGSNFKAILYEAITYIPVIGNLVQSVNAASQGNYWQAAGYLGLAVLDVIPPAKLVSTTVKVAHVASTASRVASSAKTAVRISESGLLRSSNKLMGVERASDNLMVAIGSRRDLRTGNDIVRLLDMQKAEAAMFDGTNLILHRPNPSKAAMLEEFLHGTQSKLGLTSRPGFNAEAHVKSFMIRHQKMLGLSAADVEILQQLMNSGL
ncbi:MAG: hypothetical protein LBK99_17425 [Opitutaceae bacterium]|nr:hypothetical protein [Opitutaceae bacterium]